MEGLEGLGADEVVQKTSGEKTLDFLKTAAPGIIEAATQAAQKDKPKTPTQMPYKSDKPSWFTSPQLGGIPGWGVLVGGAGLLTGLGFLIKRLAK